MTKVLLIATAFLTACGSTAMDPEEKLYQDVAASTFVLKAPSRMAGGTGFVVDYGGFLKYTVTNAHVCLLAEDDKMIAEVGSNPQIVKVLYISDKSDLCITTAPDGIRPLPMAESGMEHYKRYYKIGHASLYPANLESGYFLEETSVSIPDGQTLEKCVGPKYSIQMNFLGQSFCVATVEGYRTTIKTYPGDSGSPVVNAEGEVVGVAFASDSDKHWGLAIPLGAIKELLKDYTKSL